MVNTLGKMQIWRLYLQLNAHSDCSLSSMAITAHPVEEGAVFPSAIIEKIQFKPRISLTFL